MRKQCKFQLQHQWQHHLSQQLKQQQLQRQKTKPKTKIQNFSSHFIRVKFCNKREREETFWHKKMVFNKTAEKMVSALAAAKN